MKPSVTFAPLFRAAGGQVSEAKPLAVFAIQGTGFGFIGGRFYDVPLYIQRHQHDECQ
jgi:hypothetical protein